MSRQLFHYKNSCVLVSITKINQIFYLIFVKYLLNTKMYMAGWNKFNNLPDNKQDITSGVKFYISPKGSFYMYLPKKRQEPF